MSCTKSESLIHIRWWKFLTTCFGPLFERGTTSTCHCGARTACVKNGLSPFDGHSQIYTPLAHSRKRHLVLCVWNKSVRMSISGPKKCAVAGYLFILLNERRVSAAACINYILYESWWKVRMCDAFRHGVCGRAHKLSPGLFERYAYAHKQTLHTCAPIENYVTVIIT